ncbi:hypothetical protein BOTCAL_0341g00090 [Botryotinia calthae]|uniref:Uncharacterized protein n=1 Tax=Botryotinia calthae TaxID=38488 RepID=A0A4Y8CSU3_9HELO|nr:hypothetical protein BOTCAL_0341g00090 [Botryotinia calthae]
MACESAEHRLQQDNLRIEFLERQTLESQTFMERIMNLEKNKNNMTHLAEENKVSRESIREHMSKFQSTSDQVAQFKKEVQSYENKLGSVAVALDNRRLQQLKEHTELIEEKMSHIRTDFNNMITKSAAELSDMAVKQQNHHIDDLLQSIRPMMLRLGGLESIERKADDMMMIRLAALEEKSERHVSRILELERGNESLRRERKKL